MKQNKRRIDPRYFLAETNEIEDKEQNAKPDNPVPPIVKQIKQIAKEIPFLRDRMDRFFPATSSGLSEPYSPSLQEPTEFKNGLGTILMEFWIALPEKERTQPFLHSLLEQFAELLRDNLNMEMRPSSENDTVWEGRTVEGQFIQIWISHIMARSNHMSLKVYINLEM